MSFQTSKLTESEVNRGNIKLDNQDISVSDFNRALESLKPGQRILETSDHNFHTVERMRD